MFLNNIKHNLIIIFCILLMINGCNRENSKLIIENKSTPEKTKITKEKSKITNKAFINKNNLKKKVLKSTILKKILKYPKKNKQVILFLNLEMKDYFKAEIFLITLKIKKRG